MNRIKQWGWLLSILMTVFSCSKKEEASTKQPVHKDVAYRQDFSKKFDLLEEGVALKKVYSDRNGVIQIFSSAGLLKTYGGEFLYPGTLVPDKTYRPIVDKKILDLDLYNDQFVYLEDKAVLSNAWAGELYSRYTMPKASIFEGGEAFSFLISDGKSMQYLKDSKVLWQGNNKDEIIDIVFDKNRNTFWLLSANSISVFSVKDLTVAPAFTGKDFTCFAIANNTKDIIVGTNNGYLLIDADSRQQKGEAITKLPWTEITTIQEIDDKIWFGTTKGAFTTDSNGKFSYYASRRWLPSDTVVDIEKGPDNSILVLTTKGLGQICFKNMNLHEKAMYYEKQVRARHIRHGFNATLG